MELNWSLYRPECWTLAPFSNQRSANGTLSKSAARSRGVELVKALLCPEFVVIAARDFEGWKTDFNICT
jgi:hypothetical protein